MTSCDMYNQYNYKMSIIITGSCWIQTIYTLTPSLADNVWISNTSLNEAISEQIKLILSLFFK